MKKTIAALVLAVLCLASGALAATTTLTTTVPPRAHSLRLDIGAGGSVNGKRGAAELSVEPGQPLTLLIAPDRGYKLLSVVYNGEDVTTRLSGGRFVIDAVEADGELVVRFTATTAATPTPAATATTATSNASAAKAPNPKTGDSAQPLLWAALLLSGFAGVYILRKRQGGDGA